VHTGQSGKTGSSQQMMQNRFDPIVGVVGDGDVAAFELARHSFQELISRDAGGFFEVQSVGCRSCRDVDSLCTDRDAEFLAKRLGPFGVGVGRGASHLMIEMGRMNDESELIGESI